MSDHYKNYEILGLKPGDSWEVLRSSYKSAIRRWHPDRFVRDPTERADAEEQTKTINRAYRELSDYYEQHGRLPLEPDVRPPRPSSVDAQYATSQENYSAHDSDLHQTAGTWMHDDLPAEESGQRGGLFWILVAALLLTVLYFFFYPDEEAPPPNPITESLSATPVASDTTHRDTDGLGKTYFSVGSTLDQVYTIQGTPSGIETRLNEQAWHYGDAVVFFKDGRVTDWLDPEDRQLRVQHSRPRMTSAAAASFTKGSTKDEVLAAQGTPIRETENVWDYGVSQIYFEGGRVSGWHESPLAPLHIAR